MTLDIVRTYRAPRRVIRRRLDAGRREERALAILMLACGLIFVAQWPRLAREAFLSGQDLMMMIGGALFGWVFLAPLALYVLAALGHLVARAFGGRSDWYGARVALFWALLAASPLWLLNGLVAGFVGPGPALAGVGSIALATFLAFWMLGLVEAERPGGATA